MMGAGMGFMGGFPPAMMMNPMGMGMSLNPIGMDFASLYNAELMARRAMMERQAMAAAMSSFNNGNPAPAPFGGAGNSGRGPSNNQPDGSVEKPSSTAEV
jgi:hypothetical protein